MKVRKSMTEYISIDDVMSIFDDYMRGDVNEDDRDTFFNMLQDKIESGGSMTKDEKDIIIKMLINEKNCYEGDCRRRMAEEYGKMKGAEYMIQRFIDNFKTEESEKENDT